MDHARVHPVLAGGTGGTPPKLLIAVGDYVDGKGPVLDELVDVALAERFGWTWTELDEQDMARVLPAVAAANISAALGRIRSWIQASSGGKAAPYPPASDFAIQKHISDLRNSRE